MARYEFSFEATPELGSAALKCILWKRGKLAGPAALVLIPLLILVLGSDPEWRTAAAILGGATLMLLTLFLLAVQQRRRAIRRFHASAPNRLVRIEIDDKAITVTTALARSALDWSTIERIWHCETVALLFYQGWNYVAVPSKALPAGALEFARSRAGRVSQVG